MWWDYQGYALRLSAEAGTQIYSPRDGEGCRKLLAQWPDEDWNRAARWIRQQSAAAAEMEA